MAPKVLIVGQGLAGTIMAFELLKKGFRVKINSFQMPGAASPSAIGVLNPVILKKIRPIWMVEKCMSSAITFYSETQNLIGGNWFHKMHVLKKLSSQIEQNDWLIKSESESLKKYLGPIVDVDLNSFKFDSTYGWGQVNETAWVDIPHFILCAKKYFEKLNIHKSEKFDYGAINFQPECSYKSELFDQIIFCEGWCLLKNPFFPDLPLIPAKGDNLKISYPNHGLKNIIKQKYFLIPINSSELLCGSTFEWDFESTELSKVALSQLTKELNRDLKHEFKIISQASGVRPTVRDRRALLGRHVIHPELFLFNGLGTRGILLAPFLADMAIQNMFSAREIQEEVDYRRFLN